jgi:3,5-epimerase/4-reductase
MMDYYSECAMPSALERYNKLNETSKSWDPCPTSDMIWKIIKESKDYSMAGYLTFGIKENEQNLLKLVSTPKILVYGGKGWIGQHFIKFLGPVIHTECRADDEVGVREELDRIKPTHVISLIGRTHGPGCPTIDYLEQPGKLRENIRDNLYAPLFLALICKEKNIHLTYFGTGCIFDGSKKKYTEEDVPDFFGSSYSTVKGFTDRIMHLFGDTVLNVRIRMPVAPGPRNFIQKILSYEKICSNPNSISVLDSLFPCLVDMVLNKKTGTINLTNPGVISHNEILQMYHDIVDPTFTWKNFSIKEQDAILQSKRSNNHLDTTKLEIEYNVPCIQDAISNYFKS